MSYPTQAPNASTNGHDEPGFEETMRRILLALDYNPSIPSEFERIKPYTDHLRSRFSSWDHAEMASKSPAEDTARAFLAMIMYYKNHPGSSTTIGEFMEAHSQELDLIAGRVSRLYTAVRLLRLWMLFEDGLFLVCPKSVETPYEKERWDSGGFTLTEFVNAILEDVQPRPVPNEEQQSPRWNRIDRSDLKVQRLQEIGGLSIEWTLDAEKHLLLEEDTGQLYLFRLPCRLLRTTTSDSDEVIAAFGYSTEWRNEILYSYGMIFGRRSGQGTKYFKKEVKELKRNGLFDPVLKKRACVEMLHEKAWEYEKYRHHWRRLKALQRYVEEQKSHRSLWQILKDTSDTYGFWTFMIALLAFVLAFLSLIVSSVTGIMQLRDNSPKEVIIVGIKF